MRVRLHVDGASNLHHCIRARLAHHGVAFLPSLSPLSREACLPRREWLVFPPRTTRDFLRAQGGMFAPLFARASAASNARGVRGPGSLLRGAPSSRPLERSRGAKIACAKKPYEFARTFRRPPSDVEPGAQQQHQETHHSEHMYYSIESHDHNTVETELVLPTIVGRLFVSLLQRWQRIGTKSWRTSMLIVLHAERGRACGGLV